MSLVTLQRGRDGERMAVYLQGSNNRVMTGVDLYGSPCLHNNSVLLLISLNLLHVAQLFSRLK